MPERYFVSNYTIIYEERRGQSNISEVVVEGSGLNSTLSASCGGQTVRARVQANSGNNIGNTSEYSSWYQTGEVFFVSMILKAYTIRTHFVFYTTV